jgi:hypothetical protein
VVDTNAEKPKKIRKLSLRQSKVVELMAKKTGKVGKMKDILKKAGYSEHIQDSPHKVLEKPSIQYALEQAGLTDEYLVAKHKKLIESAKEDISLRALEMAHKIKGNFKDKMEVTGAGGNPISFTI